MRNPLIDRIAAVLLESCLLLGCAAPAGTPPAPHADPAPAALAAMPPDKDADLKLYYADGRVLSGAEALERMQREAGVVLWLAGNQFVAMDDVIRAFQRHERGLSVGLITLPPGLLRTGIEKGGWRYGGREFPGLPDVYASVNLEDLRKLKARGLMSDYAVYMHNELVLMVARGNPKRIGGVEDLRRADVRTSMPNPVNEGIMQCCGRKVLEKHDLWRHISGGKECFSCQATPLNWFTSVHHRETPDRILAGQSDTGIVWLTEAIAARQEGQAVEAVRLPPEDSLRDEVIYVIGALATTSRGSAAERYLSFIATEEAQEIYARHGFVKATRDELQSRPIPLNGRRDP